MPMDSFPILGKIVRFLKGLSWLSPLIRNLVRGLERWIVSEEHLLRLQRTQVWFTVLARWFTGICNFTQMI